MSGRPLRGSGDAPLAKPPGSQPTPRSKPSTETAPTRITETVVLDAGLRFCCSNTLWHPIVEEVCADGEARCGKPETAPSAPLEHDRAEFFDVPGVATRRGDVNRRAGLHVVKRPFVEGGDASQYRTQPWHSPFRRRRLAAVRNPEPLAVNRGSGSRKARRRTVNCSIRHARWRGLSLLCVGSESTARGKAKPKMRKTPLTAPDSVERHGFCMLYPRWMPYTSWSPGDLGSGQRAIWKSHTMKEAPNAESSTGYYPLEIKVTVRSHRKTMRRIKEWIVAPEHGSEQRLSFSRSVQGQLTVATRHQEHKWLGNQVFPGGPDRSFPYTSGARPHQPSFKPPCHPRVAQARLRSPLLPDHAAIQTLKRWNPYCLT